MSRKVSRARLAAQVAAGSLKNVPASKLAKELAAYLIAERRTGELESLMRDIMQYRADHGIVEVKATIAHPFNDHIRGDIKADIKGLYPAARQIIIDEQLDPAILGSIRLELANQSFDASLRAKLNHFKQLTMLTNKAGKE
jgi:F0F1-type ATP synthase delta subunit